jgi:hypothetical protein
MTARARLVGRDENGPGHGMAQPLQLDYWHGRGLKMTVRA